MDTLGLFAKNASAKEALLVGQIEEARVNPSAAKGARASRSALAGLHPRYTRYACVGVGMLDAFVAPCTNFSGRLRDGDGLLKSCKSATLQHDPVRKSLRSSFIVHPVSCWWQEAKLLIPPGS